MPKVIFNTHTFTCNACGWRKECDKRTLSHAVKLHKRLVHKQKMDDLGFKDTMIVPKRKDPKQLYYIDTVMVPTNKTL